jgi:hypothetical protein
MYNSYTLYQAEHVKTQREQREADIRAGELAAGFGRLWHSLVHLTAGRQPVFAPAIETIPARDVCCATTGSHAICG